MSAGSVSPADGATEDSAVPATSLLGVEGADAVQPTGPDKSGMSEEGGVDFGEHGVAAHDEADPERAGSADAHPEAADSAGAHPEAADSADVEADSLAGESGSPGDDGDGPDAPADHWPDADFHADADADADADSDRPGDDDLRRGRRPLGSAPLLDSEPLPATMPGMLRPRQADGFSLPAQRPAFDIGPEEPADIS
jgi:arginase